MKCLHRAVSDEVSDGRHRASRSVFGSMHETSFVSALNKSTAAKQGSKSRGLSVWEPDRTDRLADRLIGPVWCLAGTVTLQDIRVNGYVRNYVN